MSHARLAPVLGHLRRLVSTAEGRPDAELLHAYCASGDPDAFAALMQRYGPLVWRVCRQVLGHQQDAEDAYQATFLVLARKAPSVRATSRLASWLYGVAYRSAMSAKRAAGRRRRREQLVAVNEPRGPAWEAAWQEIQALLHEEIERLPARYKQPFLLCSMEGLGRAEVARQLGLKEGTVWSRLAEARKRLRQRLARRGVELSAVLAGLAVAKETAAVPASLEQATMEAALDYAAGQAAKAVSSAGVAALVHGLTTAMVTARFKLALGLALVLGVLTSAAALIAGASQAGDQSQARTASPPPAGQGTPTHPEPQREPLPAGALFRFGSTRYRAGGGGINQAAVTPDGKILAAATEAGITLFDLATGRQRALAGTNVPNGFDTTNNKLVFSGDGKCLINVTTGGNLRVHDAATGRFLRQFGNQIDSPSGTAVFLPVPVPAGGTTHWSTVWCPPQGRYLIAGAGQRIHLLDVGSGKVERSFEVVGEPTDVSPDGKRLVSLDEKASEAIVYDRAGKVQRRLKQAGSMCKATFASAGRLLVTFNKLSEICVWETATGKKRLTLPSPTGKSAAMPGFALLTVTAVTRDGRTLLAGTQKGEILRWDLMTGKALERWKLHYHWVTGLFCQPDGRSLVSVSWDNVIHRTDLATGRALPSGDGYTGHLVAARSPNGRAVAVGDVAGRLDLWDATTGRRLRMLRKGGAGLSALCFSPDGTRLALGPTDGVVEVIDQAGKVQKRWRVGTPASRDAMYGTYLESLVFSPDGRHLCASARERGTSLYEVRTGKEVWHEGAVGKAAFSPDGKTLVTGGWDKMLHFRDAATGKVRATVACGPNEFVDCICFSPTGDTLATGHHGGALYLRDAQTGGVQTRLAGFQEVVWDVSFSPDGKWIAAAGDHAVRLWETATGKELRCCRGPDGRAMQALFGADGRTLLSTSFDLTALLWDLRPKPGNKKRAAQLWDDLAAQPEAAYAALWALVEDPRTACTLLQSKIAPVHGAVDRERIQRLVAQLDQSKFRQREAAMHALAALGPGIAGELRQALQKTNSPEVRRRLSYLLGVLKEKASGANLRQTRAVHVLELCGTPEARRLLSQWAQGAAEADLTQDARAALVRLEKRRP